MNRIIRGDNLKILPTLPDGFARLIYIDPPFNTGKVQKRRRMKVTVAAAHEGNRNGFGGKRVRATWVKSASYGDDLGSGDAYLDFLMPRIEASLHCLTADGSFMVHLDYREVHHVKVALDRLLGRERFMNEIIWSYDYGGRPRNRWPCKHDTILWYAMNPKPSRGHGGGGDGGGDYVFNYDAIDRIPYMAPNLVTPEKAARGKTPTDVWWHTIVPTNSKEKTGYPTQKPLGIMKRIIAVHTNPGDCVLDFFAGSGTTGMAAIQADSGERRFCLIDKHPSAIRVMTRRLGIKAAGLE